MKDISLPALHANLRAWYDKNGRHSLPWRNTPDPYAIYVSEIMLQQTQVATVLERFYHPFLTRFPTLSALAEASLEEVLKYWEGLGYYNRARYLHETAKRTAPVLPEDVEALQALPGIGRNTAHAIAAFAHRQPVPVMEANVKRILHRLFALKEAPEKLLWEKAVELLDKLNPFDHNQAMMDIGSMVCTKTRPACPTCPLAAACKGKHAPEKYPTARKRTRAPERERRIIAFADAAGRYFIARRESRFLHGLYGFPEYDAGNHTIHFGEKSYPLSIASHLGNISQTYSHFRLEASVYSIQLRKRHNAPEWRSLQEIGELPLSGADRKVLQLLESTLAA